MNDALPYRVSYAAEKAKCEKCRHTIKQGALQIAIMVQVNTHWAQQRRFHLLFAYLSLCIDLVRSDFLLNKIKRWPVAVQINSLKQMGHCSSENAFLTQCVIGSSQFGHIQFEWECKTRNRLCMTLSYFLAGIKWCWFPLSFSFSQMKTIVNTRHGTISNVSSRLVYR